MAVEVTMPKLTDSMEEGRIVEWKVKTGDAVGEGDVIAEVETDKAVMELESFWNGTVAEILHGDGDVVAVGEVIARIAEGGEETAEEPGKKPPRGGGEEAEEPEEEKPEREEAGEDVEAPGEEEKRRPEERKEAESPRSAESGRRRTEEARSAAEDKAGKVLEEEIPIPGGHLRAEGQPGDRERASDRGSASTGVRASPRARKLAEESGLDLEKIEGTGPEGRITVEDVEQAAGGQPTGEPPRERRSRGGEGGKRVEPAALALAEKRGVALEGLEGMGVGGRVTVDDVLSAASRERKAQKGEKHSGPDRADEELPEIAFAEDEAAAEEVSFYQKAAIRRVVASKHVIPHFYLTKAVDADALLARKEAETAESEATLTHLLMCACARALEKFPEANRSYDRGRWIRWKVVHLGLAVQTDAGLVVAVLRNAQGKDLRWIVQHTRPLVERARAGKLKNEERTNPTFTISNLGAFDVESFSAIINPPSALTLAVGSVVPTPVVRDGEVVPGNLLHLTLSCDHRVVDGVLAARFLGEVKAQLEAAEAL